MRTPCPGQPPLDESAQPAFPILGDDGPFAHLPRTPLSPVFCVNIDARGRILAVTVGASSGDPRADRTLARTIRTLSFTPATRDGRRTPAWHRLAVNRGVGEDWLIDPNPDHAPAEPIEQDHFQLTD